MEFLHKVLTFLSAEMNPPTVFGWFHLLFICLILALTIFLCIRFKNSSDKVFRRIVLMCWIIPTVLEVYKQIHYVPFVIIYVLGVMLVAIIIYSIARVIILLENKGEKTICLKIIKVK